MIFGLLYFCVVIVCVNGSRSSFILYRIVKRHSRQSNVRRIWTCADNDVLAEFSPLGAFFPDLIFIGFQQRLQSFLISHVMQLKSFVTFFVPVYAPVICIPGSLGAGDSGDITGPKCRDLTFDESRQCRRFAGVLISRQNTNLCHILTTRRKLSLYICTV